MPHLLGQTLPNRSHQRLWAFGVPSIVHRRVMADLLELDVWDSSRWDQAVWQ